MPDPNKPIPLTAYLESAAPDFAADQPLKGDKKTLNHLVRQLRLRKALRFLERALIDARTNDEDAGYLWRSPAFLIAVFTAASLSGLFLGPLLGHILAVLWLPVACIGAILASVNFKKQLKDLFARVRSRLEERISHTLRGLGERTPATAALLKSLQKIIGTENELHYSDPTIFGQCEESLKNFTDIDLVELLAFGRYRFGFRPAPSLMLKQMFVIPPAKKEAASSKGKKLSRKRANVVKILNLGQPLLKDEFAQYVSDVRVKFRRKNERDGRIHTIFILYMMKISKENFSTLASLENYFEAKRYRSERLGKYTVETKIFTDLDISSTDVDSLGTKNLKTIFDGDRAAVRKLVDILDIHP